MYPDASVPVVQLALNALKPFEYHLELASRLAPLRERGVVVLGSGNVVHNLRLVDWHRPDAAFDWAQRFDDAVHEIMTIDPARILSVTSHPDFARAVPTPDHFLPLLYLAGLASKDEPAVALVRGYSMGALSMTAYGVGCGMSAAGRSGDAAAAPLPADVPADQTNT